jgi:uncharacterized integral membrane protein
MLHKILTAIVVIPLLIIVVGFAVAKRHAVTVSFDPFSATQPAYAVTLPLFVVIFILVILGVIVGGIATWLRQNSWRRSARRLDAQVRALHEEMRAMRTNAASDHRHQRPEVHPPLVLPPI